jgi:hypothetical protein
LKIDGAANKITFNTDLVADSMQWVDGFDKSGTNLNQLTSSGFFIGNNLTNSPDGSSGRFWVLVQHGLNDSYVSQTAWDHGAAVPKIYARNCFADTWSAWVPLTNSVLQALAAGATAASGKKRIPAFDNTGAFSASSVVIDTATGASLMNAGTAGAARGTMSIATSDNVNFNRVHAGADTVNYDFTSDTTDCSFMSSAVIKSARTSADALQLQRNGSNGDIASFYRGTNKVGSISVTGSATNYGVSSDYRLKYDVVDLVDLRLAEQGLDDYLPALLWKLMAVRPVSHRWIGVDEPDAEPTFGYIAHELQQWFPNAVVGEKDAEVEIGTAMRLEMIEIVSEEVRNEKGKIVEPAVTRKFPELIVENVTLLEAQEMGASWHQTGTRPIYQTVDPSKLSAVHTAAIQELTMLLVEQRATIEALSARVARLEA